jgi:D-amino-acid oxidase
VDVDVIVVGSGVSGLTTAVILAEAGERVLVWGREPAALTTSAVAGALWEPYRIEPRDLVLGWSRRTFEVFARLAENPDETGVRMVAGLQAYPAPAEPPWWASAVPGVLRPVGAGDLPPGYQAGYRARLPLIDMPAYLRYLELRLRGAGGEIERRGLDSLDQAAAAAPRVVNCTGLGARQLVPDTRVRPVSGQLVVVRNPGLDQWFVEASETAGEATYIFPQPYGVVLGGTAREDDWATGPDPSAAKAIVARCAAVDPRLADAPVLQHRVGLRPSRPRVRLEAERRADGGLLVHNYGHGGAGVTVSWGCAADAAAMAGGTGPGRPRGIVTPGPAPRSRGRSRRSRGA